MKRNLILYLVSRLAEKLRDSFFFWYGVIRSAWLGELGDYLEENAIINDVAIGVTGKYFLNDTMHVSGPKAGNRLQTISCWMGLAKLSRFGNWWLKWLGRREESHCEKAVELHKQNIIQELNDLNRNGSEKPTILV